MKERILIVDDEAPVRELLAGMLSLADYQVDQAGSAHEGLAQLGQRPYDLLLTDLRLPGMSGLQFLEAAHRLDPACGRLIVTGYGTLESAMAAMELGAHGFILKPVTSADLLKTVASTLERVQALREQQRLQALSPLRAIAQASQGGAQPEMVAEALLDVLQRELQAGKGLILLREKQGLRTAAVQGFSGNTRLSTDELSVILRSAAGGGEAPLLLGTESRQPGLHEVLQRYQIGSLVGIPLQGPREGMGFLLLGRGIDDPPFTLKDLEWATAWATVGALALSTSLQSNALLEVSRRADAERAAAQTQGQEVQPLRQALERQAQEARSLEQRLEMTWNAFGEAVDLRSGARHGRAARAVELVQALAQSTALSHQVLVEAALLHDVGLARAPRSGFSPSQGETPAWRQHPVDSAASLQQMGSPQEVVLAALHHHESYDGSGFPDGLVGNAIPALARVLRVVDAYLDLVYGVPGSEPLHQEEALAKVRDGAGFLFDPSLVERLARFLGEGTEGRPQRPG